MVLLQFTLLAGHPSDPPDVPSLSQAGQDLESLVESGELTVRCVTGE